jgi:hypothetical protein
MLLTIALGIGYFLFLKTPSDTTAPTNTTGGTTSPFTPFPRAGTTTPTTNTSSSNNTGTQSTTTTVATPAIPTLRQLYTLPVGGMGATTTASTTVLRFIDRGTGHVYEAPANSLDVKKLSNTTLPRVYESYWNRNATGFTLRYMKTDTDVISTFYAELKSLLSPATTTAASASTTDFELRGKYLSSGITEIAISPKKDKLFELVATDSGSIGYVSSFDERTKVQIFETLFTQLNVEWPEENTVSLTTKGSSFEPGFLYFFDIKKASMKSVLGGIRGLSTLTSRDASKVLYSGTNGRTIKSAVYDVKTGKSEDMVFRTPPEKCVWSTLDQDDLYCAVPSNIPTDEANYPDAWYQGKVSFVDNIWHIDTKTGEVHQIASLLSDSGKLIDAINLMLDPKEHFLYFINKKDLSLWSLDITQ